MSDAVVSLRKYTSRLSNAMRMCGPSPGRRFGRNKVRGLSISVPSNFRRETTCIPGLSEDELCSLRENAYEKALASRVGIMNPESMSPGRPAPAIPIRPRGGPMSSNPVLVDGQEGPDDEKHPMLPSGEVS